MTALRSRWSARTLIAWGALLAFETLCQISLKFAGRQTGAFDFSLAAFQRALATPWLWVAIGCYVGAFLAWMTILRKSTLSAAFTISAIVLIAVMVASWLVFGEHLSWLQLFGAAIIVAGILAIGDDAAGAAPSTARPAQGNLAPPMTMPTTSKIRGES
jgi:drug/metabolite transporter (DMT)-like permease